MNSKNQLRFECMAFNAAKNMNVEEVAHPVANERVVEEDEEEPHAAETKE
jgi:hypothetical protein